MYYPLTSEKKEKVKNKKLRAGAKTKQITLKKT